MRTREQLRDIGQFWTPKWLAKAMAEYVSKDTNEVLDPATGNGIFLESLIDLDRDIVFYGFDTDESVIKSDIYSNKNAYVEHRDFIKNPPDRKFKAIIANPPYIRHQRIDQETKQLLRKISSTNIGIEIDNRAGLHIYFLIQSLSLLEQNGKLCFVVPADTCEGKFSSTLWRWISSNFRIDAVATFSPNATPFPNIDTNAIVLFIKREAPTEYINWIEVTDTSNSLYEYVRNGFSGKFIDIISHKRELSEAITTGLSRPLNTNPLSKYTLSDFADVMRGIATGCNEFFFLTSKQIKDSSLNHGDFVRAIGRSKDCNSTVLSNDMLDMLDANGRPTYLLNIKTDINQETEEYIANGEANRYHERALIKQRKPWYKTEKREVPAILFSYLGRKTNRYIKNDAGVVPLNGFICVYPHIKDKEYINRLHQALNHQDVASCMKYVAKSYGDGALKIEPSMLGKLSIPEHIVEMYELEQ